MHRTAGFVAACALVFIPRLASAQLVLRDDVDGWGWLTVVTDRRAIVQLAYAADNDQGRLDAELLEHMRGRGVRRLFGQESFEPGESQVVAECTGTNWAPAGSTQMQVAIHAEVSYWDHTRLAATEIYEALTVGGAAPEQFSPEAYVEGCSRMLIGILVRLGFDRG
jgi:hypothetical protein